MPRNTSNTTDADHALAAIDAAIYALQQGHGMLIDREGWYADEIDELITSLQDSKTATEAYRDQGCVPAIPFPMEDSE